MGSMNKTVTASNDQALHGAQGSLFSYITGYVFSLELTIVAYVLVVRHAFHNRTLVAVISGLALAQFVVQLLFFLHLGREARPKWKLFVFWLMMVIVVIVVGGSLWVMYNLNYHMSPSQMQQYLQNQDGGI